MLPSRQRWVRAPRFRRSDMGWLIIILVVLAIIALLFYIFGHARR